jgi:hypothetical protein
VSNPVAAVSNPVAAVSNPVAAAYNDDRLLDKVFCRCRKCSKTLAHRERGGFGWNRHQG